MIDIGQHAEFIFGAYGVTMLLVGSLVLYVNRDYHTQEKRLKELESQGIRRRSDEPKS